MKITGLKFPYKILLKPILLSWRTSVSLDRFVEREGLVLHLDFESFVTFLLLAA